MQKIKRSDVFGGKSFPELIYKMVVAADEGSDVNPCG